MLVLGGADDRLHDGPVTYTPIVGGPDRYNAAIESAEVGGEAVAVPSGVVALIDTGTSLMLVPQRVFEGYRKILQTPKYCDELPNICPTDDQPDTIFDSIVTFNATDIPKLPTLKLKATGGVELELRPEDYMYQVSKKVHKDGTAEYGLAFNGTTAGEFLLGQVLLRRYYVEFDNEGRRMGFAKAVKDCKGAAGL